MIKIHFKDKKHPDEEFEYTFDSPDKAVRFIAENYDLDAEILEGEELLEAFMEYEEIELGGEG